MAVHYYPLVNRVMTLFQVQEGLRGPYRNLGESQFPHPFLTVAREPGSGGAPIARAVAQKLGFACVDEQIIDDIALSTKKRKEVVKAVDEKARSRIEDIVHSLINPEYIDDMKYVTELTKVLLSYAHRGRVVIVGRGGNYITPFAKGLHVNITAPYEVRVQRAMQFEGFSRSRAEEVIASVEVERKNFVRQYLQHEPDKINAYDISINTALFNVDNAANIITEAFYRKFPRSVRYLSFLQK